MLSSLLILSVIGLMVPALFDYTERGLIGRTNPAGLDESLSLGVSLVLLAVYLLNLIYSFYTNHDEFNAAGAGPGMGEVVWSKRKSLAVLAVCISIVAMGAELISSSLEVTAVQISPTPFFLGVAVLEIVGNAAECASAVYFARKGSMDLVMSIIVGSTIQMALFIAPPLLVVLSYFTGNPMSQVFANLLELIAVAGVAFAVNAIAEDGNSHLVRGGSTGSRICYISHGFSLCNAVKRR